MLSSRNLLDVLKELVDFAFKTTLFLRRRYVSRAIYGGVVFRKRVYFLVTVLLTSNFK